MQVYCFGWTLLWNQPEDFPTRVWFIKGLYNLSKFFPYYWQSSRWPSPADTSRYCCLAAASPMEFSRVSFLDQVWLECCNIRAKGSGLGSFAESGDLVVVRECGSFICFLQIHTTPLLVWQSCALRWVDPTSDSGGPIRVTQWLVGGELIAWDAPQVVKLKTFYNRYGKRHRVSPDVKNEAPVIVTAIFQGAKAALSGA